MSSIRRQINIAAPPRSVWRMLTTDEGWCSWYADQARVDGRSGGRVVLTTEDDEGAPLQETGFIHTWRPTSRLEIAWDARSPAISRGGRTLFQVARDGEETRLSLIHSGGEALQSAESTQALDALWRRSLKALRDALEAE